MSVTDFELLQMRTYDMSRRFTLEEYLERFVDEETESGDEIRFLVSDAQVKSVGLFFIECMGGILQCLGSQRGTSPSRGTRSEQSDKVTAEVNTDEDDFIN
jgi:hypothetical protein